MSLGEFIALASVSVSASVHVVIVKNDLPTKAVLL
jgi:hypothetical protein